MSGGEDSSPKKHEPSDRRLRKLREQGQVPHSQAMSTFGCLAGGCLGLFIFLPPGFERLIHMMEEAPRLSVMPLYEALVLLVPLCAITLAVTLGPVIGFAFLGAMIGSIVATGGIAISTKPLTPDFKRLDPASNIKQKFGLRLIAADLPQMSLLPPLAVGIFAPMILAALPGMIFVPFGQFAGVVGAAVTLFTSVLGGGMFLALVAAGADIFVQRRLFRHQNKMTDRDMKEEYKENEGHPEIKQHRKGLHRELSGVDAVSSVPSATAVVANPIHIAVSLKYERGVTPLPVVMGKGIGRVALRMIAGAREAGVPVIVERSLARSLLANAVVDKPIPVSLIEGVAAVLRIAMKISAASKVKAEDENEDDADASLEDNEDQNGDPHSTISEDEGEQR